MGRGRKPQSDYVEAARSVLTELGGGPMTSRSLVAAARERGLLPEGNWVYHNFLRKIRESNEFNTSVRGQVSFANPLEVDAPVVEVPGVEMPVPAPEEEVVNDALGAAIETNKF